MRTWKEEVHNETAKLAVSIKTAHESFERAYKRAWNLLRIKQQRETAAVLETLKFIPVCKAEVYDPDMYGGEGVYEQSDHTREEDEE